MHQNYISLTGTAVALSVQQNLLSTTPFYIFPGDYIVVTEDADNLALNYLVQNPDAVFVVSSLPSFPDDEGVVFLLNLQGAVVDEVKY